MHSVLYCTYKERELKHFSFIFLSRYEYFYERPYLLSLRKCKKYYFDCLKGYSVFIPIELLNMSEVVQYREFIKVHRLILNDLNIKNLLIYINI